MAGTTPSHYPTLPFTTVNHGVVQVKRLHTTIDKPNCDTSEYRLIELPNGLVCLLRHSPYVEIFCVSLDVGVGRFDCLEPDAALALPIMLFMGSPKVLQLFII